MSVSVQLNTDYQSAYRFPGWMALAVTSAVCVAAISSITDKEDRTRTDKWVLSASAISMVLSFIAVLFYLLHRAVFVGQILEAGMVIVVLAFWGAALPFIMDPSNNLAVEDTIINNANLYFFSWLSFAGCLFLAGSLAKDVSGISVNDVVSDSRKTIPWFGLTGSSLVVLGASVRLFKSSNCDYERITHLPFCKRTKWGIAVGIISFLFAAIFTYLIQIGVLNLVIELTMATLLVAFWCFGVGYLTFGVGPGSTTGNLYFASWISFLISVYIFTQCFRECIGGGDGAQQQSDEPEHDLSDPNHSPMPPAEDDI